MRFPLGQPIYIPLTVKDRNGALVDAGTLTLVVQNPDATQQTFSSPTHDSTGTYHQDISATALTQLGHYQWVGTSTGAGAGVVRGEFDVFDPFEPDLLPLQDAKRAANIPAATTVYDDDLQSYVDTITSTLEMITGGPIVNRSISERAPVTGNLRSIVLRQRPLVSVTSITDTATGLVMPITDLDPDLNSGILRRKLGFPFWSRGIYYQVVYVAGWGTTIPAAFNTAAKIIIQHLWETQRGPGLSPMAGLEETILPGMSFAIPNRALELLRPYSQEAYF